MKQKYFFLFAFFSTFLLAAFCLAESQEEIKEYKRNKYEIENIKSNPDLYAADGVVSYEAGDAKAYPQAREAARNDAKKSLAESIKVEIKTTVIDKLSITGVMNTTDQDFLNIVESYTKALFVNIKYKEYQDYPKKNLLTVLAQIVKADYDTQVAKELEEKKAEVVGYIQEAIKFKNNNMCLLSIVSLVKAQSKVKEYFGALPTRADLNNDGKEEDIASFLDSAIGQAVKNIEIQTNDKNVVYDAYGNVKRNPIIKVVCLKDNEATPIALVPLLVTFERGGGVIYNPNPITSDLGEAKLIIKEINAVNENTALKVEINLKKLGVSDSFIISPSILIELTRGKSFAYAVIGTEKFSTGLKAKIVSMGYDPIHIPAEEVSSSDLYANFIMILTIDTSYQEGKEYGINTGYADSKLEIYSLPDRKLISSVEGPSAEAAGRNKTEAKARAIGKIQKRIYNLVDAELGKLK